MLLDNKHIHFVGIGGIGMSAIARVLLEMGYDVSGSDVEANDLTKKLQALGGRIFEGHSASNLPKDAGVLVYSSSISKGNPEMHAARQRKVNIAHRAEILGEIFNCKKGIAVTGTHGKTTTTALIAVMLKECRLKPTVMIGGEVGQFKGNAQAGSGSYVVAEADESDSSFLYLKPFYSVITNMEMEHIDHFKTMDGVKASYRAFIGNTKKGGTVFYNFDDPNIKDILKDIRINKAGFGFSKQADIHPADIKMKGFDTSFKCIFKNKALGEIRLKIPGRHNILNAMAAVLVGIELGLDIKSIAGSIKKFTGAKRRFQVRANIGGVILIEDYAHHPTEIRAVLDACSNLKYKRLIAVFQPHRYTRTLFLVDDFGSAFKGADKLVLTDIYAASEKPLKGVSIRMIYDKVKANGMDDVVVVKKGDIPDHVMKIKKRGDLIVVMGAGDIKKAADALSSRLEENFAEDGSTAKELKGSIKGAVKSAERLAFHSSFRIGGPADLWVEPRDSGELRKVLSFANKRKIPIFVIGNGSNVLARDPGFRGMVVRLNSPSFQRMKIKGRTVCVGAGFSLARLVKIACEKGLGGLESLVGIPGTIGGAIYMNAGGWTNPVFRNIGEFVSSLKVMDYRGKAKMLRRSDMEFGYRSSNLKQYIILEATLKFEKTDAELLVSSLTQFLKMKKEKQSLDVPSAGCVFKNPEKSQFTCGQMIDMLGLKGKRIGGAEISEKHANFVINRRGATCADVLSLIELMKKKVKESYGISLELEIKVI